MATEINKKFSEGIQSTLNDLQANGESNAFVPVFTEDENYKVDVTELNSQILIPGNEKISIDGNVISAVDTQLTVAPSDVDILKIENNIISYIGPEGQSEEITTYNNDNVEINNNIVHYDLNYGTEVSGAHYDSELKTNQGTSTYFTKVGHELIPHFAGFCNNMLVFANADMIDEFDKMKLVFSDHVFLNYISPYTGPKYVLDSDFTFKPVTSQGITPIELANYNQILFNMPNINCLLFDTYWLQKSAYKEIVLVQINAATWNPEESYNKIHYIGFRNSTQNNVNFYFYHNGLVYKKLNLTPNNGINDDGIVWIFQKEGKNGYTELSDDNGVIGQLDPISLNDSFPFSCAIGTYTNEEWIANTVNRFYCITEVKDGITNFYIIESMY